MNIAVVDDEEIIRQQIHGFIEKQKPEFYISDFATGEELLAVKADFDIIFLDIQMEGMGGIEAARSLRQKNMDAVLVFITGIKEYVFDAFDVSAFHYLLKPIGEKKFMEVPGRAVDEAGRRKGQKEQQIFIKTKNHGIGLANIKSTAEKYQGTMDFKVKGRVFILSVMMKNERRSEDGFWSDR